MWRDYFRQKYAVNDGMLWCTADYPGNGLCFSIPVGKGDVRASLVDLMHYCEENDLQKRFCCVTEEGVALLKELFGEPSVLTEYRDWADYLYPYENFLGYHGKKLVTPRNHCNRFVRDYPQYEYRAMKDSDFDIAESFILNHYSSFEKPSPLAQEDLKRTVEILPHIGEFGFTGGILSVDGNVIGLSIGEAVGDTLYVHVEKALKSYSGAFPMLAMLYAKQNASERLRFINREDDSGDEGLRHSKLEYQPIEIINKYVVGY